MAADRRTKARGDATALRVLEGRVLTAAAVLARKRPPTMYELTMSAVLRGVDSADLVAALDALAAHGRIVIERDPDPNHPLIAPAIVRYRPVALSAGMATTEGGCS